MRLSRSFIFISLVCITSASQAEDLRVWLGRKDLSVEAAVRALVVATIASGNTEEGRCLHEQYFGSPLLQRMALMKAWRSQDQSAMGGIMGTLQAQCRGGQIELRTMLPSEGELWGRVDNAAVALDLSDHKPASADAAAAMLEAYVRPLSASVGDCIAGTRVDAGPENGSVPISVAVHDRLRDRCGLNAGNEQASRLSLPALADVESMARERLLIVQDLWSCGEDAVFRDCASTKYQLRAKALRPYMLRGL